MPSNLTEVYRMHVLAANIHCVLTRCNLLKQQMIQGISSTSIRILVLTIHYHDEQLLLVSCLVSISVTSLQVATPTSFTGLKKHYTCTVCKHQIWMCSQFYSFQLQHVMRDRLCFHLILINDAFSMIRSQVVRIKYKWKLDQKCFVIRPLKPHMKGACDHIKFVVEMLIHHNASLTAVKHHLLTAYLNMRSHVTLFSVFIDISIGIHAIMDFA